MQRNVGLWIDHKRAVIVTLSKRRAEVVEMLSQVEKHVRFAGQSRARPSIGTHDDFTEDKRDRRYLDHLNQFYDQVIDATADATQVLIIGPGQAKTELASRLKAKGAEDRNIAIKPADKMTNAEIAATVRRHFLK